MFSIELNFFKIVVILTGAVIAGEAMALLVGTYFLSADKAWASKNMALLILDIVTGLGLIYFGFARGSLLTSTLFFLFSGLALLTHGYREWQYFTHIETKFCFNLPLFIVNNVKLIGVVVILIRGLI